jgi:hypothetical protein
VLTLAKPFATAYKLGRKGELHARLADCILQVAYPFGKVQQVTFIQREMMML